MKKLFAVISIILALAVPAAVFTACGEDPSSVSYTLYAPDGAPVLALADMWGEDFTYDNDTVADIEYNVTGEADVATCMSSGKADFIIAPINVGAQIHAGFKAGNMQYDYRLVNVTSWGVLYFTTNADGYKARGEFAAGADGAKQFLMQFDGTDMSTIGRAAIPGKSVEYLFSQAGADVTLNNSDATTIQQAYIKGDDTTAIFAQPAITGVQSGYGDDAVTVLASVSDIYTELTGKEFPMAGLFVRTDILAAYPELIDSIDARVKTSVEKFNSDIDAVAEKAESINGFSLKAAVIKKSYDKLNVRYKDSDGAKSDVETLLGNIGAACDDSLFA